MMHFLIDALILIEFIYADEHELRIKSLES